MVLPLIIDEGDVNPEVSMSPAAIRPRVMAKVYYAIGRTDLGYNTVADLIVRIFQPSSQSSSGLQGGVLVGRSKCSLEMLVLYCGKREATDNDPLQDIGKERSMVERFDERTGLLVNDRLSGSGRYLTNNTRYPLFSSFNEFRAFVSLMLVEI